MVGGASRVFIECRVTDFPPLSAIQSTAYKRRACVHRVRNPFPSATVDTSRPREVSGRFCDNCLCPEHFSLLAFRY
ncbi:hypothetical protein CEXT_76871 [Caerostris extrusa]|uniref:Uncharacterized protein n=1 Tax=Caerostris extrusa TaxID=172846 RepID=A0AAV4ML01_CAEEX|nr:hypothetical protein CEXT_76871 [Caerostris extrusa]